MVTWNLSEDSAPSLTQLPAPVPGNLDRKGDRCREKSKRRQNRAMGREEEGPENVTPFSTPPTSS